MGVAPSIDITAEQRKTLIALLQRHLPETTAWVYGSRAKWTARPESDLDLVVFAGPEQYPQVGTLREALDESDLPFCVDLFVWDKVPEGLHQKIEAEHVELIAKPTAKTLGTWQKTRWGNIATLEYGRALRDYDSDKGSFRVYGTNGPIGWHDQALCEHASVIVGRKGAYRGIHYSADPFFVIDTAFYLKPKVEMDIRWAYYALLTHDINSMDSGSAIPSTSRDEFYSLPISVPPLSEQCAIAHILGKLDDKIELNRRMNETLEAMARALFKSWFVDFDPVRAKMECRDTGLPQHIADLFPDRLVNSELGEIPEGWAMKPLSDVANFLNGLALQKFPANNPADSLPVIKIAELRNGITDKSDKASSGILDKYVVRDGDFLFSWSGSLLAKFWTEGEGALNQHLFKVTSDRYPPWFYAAWIHIHLNEFRRIAAFKATTMGHIQRSHLQSAITICPPDNVIDKLGIVIEPLIKSTIENQVRSRTLVDLRQTLLPKLISGELRVNDISRSTETAK